MDSKTSTGSSVIDWLLEGGYDKDIVTTIYGPAGSGKTNICLIAMVHGMRKKKTIYIDSEGGFSIARLKQMTDNPKEVLDRVVFLNPVNFDEQKRVFERLKKLVNDKIGLIIFDSVAMLYRLEIGRTKKVQMVNKELSLQLSFLTEIARKRKIPILVTNQVYSDFENKDKIFMVGGDVLKYGSKCLIELQKVEDGVRKAILRKHRSLEEGKEILFKIVDKGIEEIKT
ncbi:MAG: DNA repair and recombination protein RadB [Nanoarchaeota archaeon]|nr:DNA repair and recombination protein RadB [Nanoarchaeota archaeon]